MECMHAHAKFIKFIILLRWLVEVETEKGEIICDASVSSIHL